MATGTTTRANPMKAALAAGQVQIGTWINLIRNPAVLPLLQSAGLDYGRVDMEHSSPSIETIADMAVLGRALDFPVIVRPPHGGTEWITRLLDVGVWGLHIPGVNTPEAAYEIVQASRYAPMGQRGMSGVGPHNDFGQQTSETMTFLNEQVHITVMLESAEGFQNIDDIVGMEGIDAVTLGPTDLAQNLGVYGTPKQNDVLDEHRLRLIEAAKRHNKKVAMLLNTTDEARRWIREGVSIIAYASEVAVLKNSFAEAMRAIRAE